MDDQKPTSLCLLTLAFSIVETCESSNYDSFRAFLGSRPALLTSTSCSCPR